MLEEFIKQHSRCDVNELALQRGLYKAMSDADFRYCLQQISGLQTARHKLPEISEREGWIYPARLSLEQCSSEFTAKYKSSLVGGHTLVDMTGGFGVDTYYLADRFRETTYVECSAELADLARHNFSLTDKNITVVCDYCEEYISRMSKVDCIYIDPARRSRSGGKVFMLQDCFPDIVSMLPLLQAKCDTLLLKLSPMLDISAVMNTIPHIKEIHIVAYRGEVKELLVLVDWRGVCEGLINAVNLGTSQTTLRFTYNGERALEQLPIEYSEPERFLYEPNGAIMKSGGMRVLAKKYHLKKLSANTHIFTSEEELCDFPGRQFLFERIIDKKSIKGASLSIISKDYPLTASELRVRYNIKEDAERFLIACRINGKPQLILAKRVR